MIRLLSILLCLLSLQTMGQGKLDSFNINKAVNLKSSLPINLHPYDNKIYFYAGDTISGGQLYETDGTYQPKKVFISNYNNSIIVMGGGSKLFQMATVGNKLYFAANDSIHGTEVWEYDGTNAPAMIADINLNNNNTTPTPTDPSRFTTINNHLCFTGGSPLTTLQFYNTTTKQNQSTDSIQVASNIITFHNRLYFSGRNLNQPFNIELFSYDVVTKTYKTYKNAQPLLVYNDVLYLRGDTNQLYHFDDKTMSTPLAITNTNQTGNNNFSLSSNKIVGYFGAIYFSTAPTTGGYLYRYSIQNKQVQYIDSNFLDAKGFTVYNNKLFYNAVNNTNGAELVEYNGNSSPSLVADIYSGSNSSNPTELTVSNNKLFFAADGQSIGYELFMYSEATASVKNANFKATISLYPNPTVGNTTLQLKLEKSENLSISLTNMAGQRVYQSPLKKYQQGSHSIELPSKHFSSGIYIYHINSEEGSVIASGKLKKQ